jgi:hypothetical protein
MVLVQDAPQRLQLIQPLRGQAHDLYGRVVVVAHEA